MLTIIRNILDFQFLKKNILKKEDQEKLNSYRPLLGLRPDNIIVNSFNRQLNAIRPVGSNTLQSLSPIHPQKYRSIKFLNKLGI